MSQHVCILALVMKHTNCIFSALYYVICGLSGSTLFLHIILKTT